jgi:peptidoglycan/xylan/chitin deacetylase (PgdA/CDA1 family)
MGWDTHVKPYRFPGFMERFFRPAVFRIPVNDKKIFLTFDDGPTREVTEFVLDLLERAGAKATFFVIGDKIRKHEDILHETVRRGHALANHTFYHNDAWKTDWKTYKQSIESTRRLLEEKGLSDSFLFRPPYGHITRPMLKELPQEGYRIIMWKILSLDYNSAVNPRKSLEKLKKIIRPGQIWVFHDSPKAFSSMQIILPGLLDYLLSENYKPENLITGFADNP